MGANVSFFAFREEPSFEKLSATLGLTGFRLFKRKGKAEWYIEGPNPEGQDITFYEPLDYAPSGSAFERAQAGAKKFAAICKAVNERFRHEERLINALTLSVALDTRTLLIDSNDDNADAGFICVAGEVQYAKMLGSEGNLIVFENGGVRVFQYDGGGDLHQNATEVANRFFGEVTRGRVTSDPYVFVASEYTLVQAKGQRLRPTFPGAGIEDAIWEIENSRTPGWQRLQKIVAFIEKCVSPAFQESFITATRTERGVVEWNLVACSAYFSRRRDRQSPHFEAIRLFLDKVIAYIRWLRPKPEFRRSINFSKLARKLNRKWQRLKLRLFFASVSAPK